MFARLSVVPIALRSRPMSTAASLMFNAEHLSRTACRSSYHSKRRGFSFDGPL